MKVLKFYIVVALLTITTTLSAQVAETEIGTNTIDTNQEQSQTIICNQPVTIICNQPFTIIDNNNSYNSKTSKQRNLITEKSYNRITLAYNPLTFKLLTVRETIQGFNIGYT